MEIKKQNIDFFQINCFKEWLKRCHGNSKLLQKIMSSSYHVEWKAFIEVSCNNNIHTRASVFCSCYCWRFVSHLFSDRVKKLVVYLVSLLWIFREAKIKGILFMRSIKLIKFSKLIFLYKFILKIVLQNAGRVFCQFSLRTLQ